MAGRAVYALVAALGIALASGGAWWWQQARKPVASAETASPSPAGPPGMRPGGAAGGMPSVEVALVRRASLQDDAQAVGTLRSRQSVTLRPEVSGRVAKIGFADGARVRRGQLLVQLDDVLQQAELSQAQAQLSIARANLRRNEELVAANFVAQRVLDESRASLQVAEAQVALAQARLQRMRVEAPFDGTVGLSKVNLGEFVKDGADLVNLEDTSSLTVDFRLPERYQDRVAVGQRVQVRLDALPGQQYEARVLAVDPMLDADGRSLSVRAELPGGAGQGLRPGMFARVLAIFSTDANALMIPEEAILPQGGRQFVVRLATAEGGEAAPPLSQRVPVTLGVRRDGQVQVTSGLSEGDRVVVAGQQRLQRDGTPVRVVDLSRSAGGTPDSPGAGRPSLP